MKLTLVIAMIVATFVVSCSEDDPAGVPSQTDVYGTVVVFVHWNGQGLADMRVGLVEPGIELKTDEEGLAEFVVPAGRYTLRAYDINQGGPGLRHVDTDVMVEPEHTVRVEIANCLPCV
jgi:hypothetical protein